MDRINVSAVMTSREVALLDSLIESRRALSRAEAIRQAVRLYASLAPYLSPSSVCTRTGKIEIYQDKQQLGTRIIIPELG